MDPVKRILGKGLNIPKFGKRTKWDWDGDGIPNRKDCQPRNPARQDIVKVELDDVIIPKKTRAGQFTYDKDYHKRHTFLDDSGKPVKYKHGQVIPIIMPGNIMTSGARETAIRRKLYERYPQYTLKKVVKQQVQEDLGNSWRYKFWVEAYTRRQPE
jgi:hypothetical protein